MPLPLAFPLAAAVSLLTGLAAASQASDWGDVVAVSSTMGVHDGRICVGEATRGDIGCPTYAPQVGADGSISASSFIGDGSGLTGVVASTADRIVSGTTSLLAVSSTGFVSLTQAGTNTGWFDPTRGLVALGVSTTGRISAVELTVRGRIDLVTGTRMVAVGQGAGSTNTAADFTAVGSFAGQNNTNSSAYLTAIGSSAAQNNSGSGVTSLGYAAGQNNTAHHLTAVGYQAARYNSGDYVQALGYLAAVNNTGAGVVAVGANAAAANSGSAVYVLGNNAAQYNAADYVNAMGSSAAQNNSGTYVNGIGHLAAQYNTGNYVNALGRSAAQNNASSHVNALGFIAALTNTGGYVNALGSGAAQNNTGNYVESIGYNAAQNNTGGDVVALGRDTAKNNTFSNVVALGYNAQPDKANQIVLGNGSIVEVSTAGVILARGVSTTGTVSATRFVGDGSGLTGVVASTADRIVSGTTSLVAVSSTGFVSLTQAGTNTGWFDPTRGLVALGVSTTGTVSATRGYFSGNTGFGVSNPLTTMDAAGVLHVHDAGTTADNNYQGAVRITRPSSSAQYINMVKSGMAAWSLGMTYNTTDFAIGQGAFTDSSFTNPFFVITNIGRVGIGTPTPATALETAGAIQVHDTGTPADNSYQGALRITRPAASGQYINLVRAANAAWSIGTTYGTSNFAIGQGAFTDSSFTNPFFVINTTGRVGIGVVTPTTELEVSGTISATNILVNGAAISAPQPVNHASQTGSIAFRDPSGTLRYLSSNNGFRIRGYDFNNAAYPLIDIGVSQTREAHASTLSLGGLGNRNPLYIENPNGFVASGIWINNNQDGRALSFARPGYGYVHLAMRGARLIFEDNAAAYPLLSLNSANRYVGVGTQTPTTPLEVSGTVSATAFVGDGSGLTNLQGTSTDRIISGTTSLLAVSGTGFVSLTQAGTNTGWFDPAYGLVTLGVSATGAVSATRGYFSGNLAIGSSTLPGINHREFMLYSDGPNTSAASGNAGATIYSQNRNAQLNLVTADRNANATVYFSPGLLPGNSGRGEITYHVNSDASGVDMRFGVSNSEVMRLTSSSNVGIGTTVPTTRLEVNGTVSATYVKLADNDDKPCAPEHNGTIRFFNGRISLCRAH